MSDENPPPTAPPWWARFTQSIMTTLAGFAVAIFAVTLLRATGVAEGVWLAVMLTGLGGAGFGPSLANRGTPPNERGHMAAPLLYALGIIAVCACAWAWAGCATVERNGETLGFQLRRDPARVGPACLYRLTIDGELVHSGRIDECPAVPVCEVPQ